MEGNDWSVCVYSHWVIHAIELSGGVLFMEIVHKFYCWFMLFFAILQLPIPLFGGQWHCIHVCGRTKFWQAAAVCLLSRGEIKFYLSKTILLLNVWIDNHFVYIMDYRKLLELSTFQRNWCIILHLLWKCLVYVLKDASFMRMCRFFLICATNLSQNAFCMDDRKGWRSRVQRVAHFLASCSLNCLTERKS